MARMRGGGGGGGGEESGGGGEQRERDPKHSGLVRLVQIVTMLVVFAGGVVIGLTTTSHIHYFNTNYNNNNNYLHFISQQPSSTAGVFNHIDDDIIDTLQQQQPNNCNCNCTTNNNNEPPPTPSPLPVVVVEEYEEDMLESFVHPSNITHTLSDDQLFWRASLVPTKHNYPYARVPKLAFMFLTRGPLPLLPLWERFFQGHSHLFNIYIHAPPGYLLNVSHSSPFYRRNIPSQVVSWGTVTLADAERRLLANALLDFSNERFVLLSESCIPVYNFPTVYRYLIDSAHSFVESYDDPSRYGRGRYSRNMLPDIQLKHWRKGSQWFELNRALAVYIVSDTQYFSLFRKYCKPACYPDEHYIPTFLNMFHGSLNSNRTVTWVDWSMLGPHPATYGRDNITVSFIQAIRNNGSLCRYNSDMTSICYLFARKFDPSALEPLLNLSSEVMNF
ncbi:glycosyltransferase BC10-like [Trifolium pratense]|uniref:glycosyltransferase BC10-like n=1 Tax=Trifolium pratense TaxID=57577 RepID=UPI001E690494|nr:glycosyltransferase BC10-like [Trifolium pratense]